MAHFHSQYQGRNIIITYNSNCFKLAVSKHKIHHYRIHTRKAEFRALKRLLKWGNFTYRSSHKWTRNWSEFTSKKRHLFQVGFHEVIILVYKNLDRWFGPSSFKQIHSFFLHWKKLSKWTRTKSSTNQRPDQPWSEFL